MDLFERAYDLLSDQGQKLEPIHLPVDEFISEAFSSPTFQSIEEFAMYWSSIVLQWKPKLGRIIRKDMDKNTALLQLPLVIPMVDPETSKESGKAFFDARFLAVKLRESWFLANGFFWPSEFQIWPDSYLEELGYYLGKGWRFIVSKIRGK